MISLLAQQLLPEPLRAMRDQFREGGSFGGLLLALLLLGALLGLAYMAAEFQRRKRAGVAHRMTPQRLFEELLTGLRLNKEEQTFLLSACKEAGIPHPTSLLMAEKLFDDVVSRAPRATLNPDQLSVLRRRLFPSPQRTGVVTTTAPAAASSPGRSGGQGIRQAD